jgi:hypothetical protein
VFDIALGGEPEDLRRWGDLSFGDRKIASWRGVHQHGRGIAEGSPVQILAGRHPALPLADSLTECLVLCGKVADPGSRLEGFAVAFCEGDGG